MGSILKSHLENRLRGRSPSISFILKSNNFNETKTFSTMHNDVNGGHVYHVASFMYLLRKHCQKLMPRYRLPRVKKERLRNTPRMSVLAFAPCSMARSFAAFFLLLDLTAFLASKLLMTPPRFGPCTKHEDTRSNKDLLGSRHSPSSSDPSHGGITMSAKALRKPEHLDLVVKLIFNN